MTLVSTAAGVRVSFCDRGFPLPPGKSPGPWPDPVGKCPRRNAQAPPSRSPAGFGPTPESRSSENDFGFLFALFALAFVRIEQLLAQPDRLWRHLDQFVVLDIGERLLQRHADRRRQPHRFVLGGGADIGE